MSFNKVIVMGNLTKDPEMKHLSSGKAVANFSIAINDKYKKGGEWVDSVSYLDVVVFDRQAETCNEYLSKGKPVLIEGKLQQNRWEAQDGTKRSKVEIVASRVVFLSSGDKKQVGFDNREEPAPF
jgi:single-strand DNA-binding protein